MTLNDVIIHLQDLDIIKFKKRRKMARKMSKCEILIFFNINCRKRN